MGVLRLYPTRLRARRAVRERLDSEGRHAGGTLLGWSEWLASLYRRLDDPLPLSDVLARRRLMALAWEDLGASPLKGLWHSLPAPGGLIRQALEAADRLAMHGLDAQALRTAGCAPLISAWLDAFESRRIRRGLTDRPGRLRALCEAVESGRRPWDEGIASIVLTDFIELEPLTLRLLKALAASGLRVEWQGRYPLDFPEEDLPALGEVWHQLQRKTDRLLGVLEAHFRDQARFDVHLEPLEGIGAAVEFFTAPDRYREMEEIGRRIRAILEHGDALPHRIAVVVPNRRRYWESAVDVFRRFSLPLYARIGAFAPTDEGLRWIVRLARWVVEGCPAEDWPSLAAEPRYRPALSPELWPSLVDGASAQLSRARIAPGPLLGREARLAALGDNPAPAALRQLLSGWIDLARRWRLARRLEEHRECFKEMFGLAGGDSSNSGVTPPQRRALEESLARLHLILRQTGEDARPLRPEEWLSRWREVLAETTLHGFPREEEAVNLLDFEEIQGLSFDHLFLAGLVEGEFPAAQPTNPLLDEADWARLSATHRFPHEVRPRHSAEREAYLFALAQSLARKTLTYSMPRTSDEEARPLLASRFLEAEWDRREDADRSGWSGPQSDLPANAPTPHPWRAAEPAERRAAWVAALRGHIATGPGWAVEGAQSFEAMGLDWDALGRSRDVECRRREFFESEKAQPGAFTGGLAVAPVPLSQPIAARRLEELAECPFRFSARHALGLEPLRPAEADREAMEAGTVAHRAMEWLYRPYEGRRAPPVAELAARLPECLERAWRDKASRDPEPRDRLWMEIMRRRLTAYLEAEHALEESGFNVEAVEWSFGTPEGPEFRIDWEDRSWRLSGQVDRIDWLERRARYRIIEYKNASGKDRYSRNLRFPGERGFQLPIYLLATMQSRAGWSLQPGTQSPDIDGYYALLRGAEFEGTSTDRKNPDEVFWTAMGYGDPPRTSFARKLAQRLIDYERGNWSPRPIDPKICGTCEYRRLCRR